MREHKTLYAVVCFKERDRDALALLYEPERYVNYLVVFCILLFFIAAGRFYSLFCDL